MICAYGPYSASATGGNGWSRDFLAGVLTVPATPFFTNIGKSSGKNLEYACTILFCIALVLVLAVYAIYYWGPVLRKRSKFAQKLAAKKEEGGGRRVSVEDVAAYGRRGSHHSVGVERRKSQASAKAAQAGSRPGAGERKYSQQLRTFGEPRVTPRGTPRGTPHASRANSLVLNPGKAQ